MKKKTYDEIINKYQDWGGDESTENLPVSGARVQEFIKTQLENKAGCFQYDLDSNRHLVFADEYNRDLYQQDPIENASMLMYSFEAPAPYNATITLTSQSSNTIRKGDTGNYIDFTFDIVNKSNQSTGDSIIAKFTFTNKGNKKTATQVYNAGTSVHFLIDDYLSDGANNITVSITGRSTLAATSVQVIYNVINLTLAGDFDFSESITRGNPLDVTYITSGPGQKYIEYYIDGVKFGQNDTEDRSSATKTKRIPTDALIGGKHNIQIRAYIIDATDIHYYSNVLYYDFYVRDGVLSTDVLIGRSLQQLLDGDSWTIEKYRPYDYKLAVINDKTVSVVVKDNGTQITSLSVNPKEVLSLQYYPTEIGTHTISFYINDQLYNQFTTEVIESTTGILETTDNMILKLSARGRSNSETNRGVWTYTNSQNLTYSTSFSGFTWNEQNGWVDNSLLMPKGTSININISPLNNPDTMKNGFTFEIDYETLNVEDDSAPIMSLVNSTTGAGITITATSAKLQAASGSNVETKYNSGDRVHLALIINKNTYSEVTYKNMMFIVNNGIHERAALYTNSDNFTVLNSLVIQPQRCTLKLHSIRIYDRNLTIEESFQNYAIDSSNIQSIIDRNDILVDGVINADKVNTKIPIMIFTGEGVPSILNSGDKDYKQPVDIEYINLLDPSKNFTAKNALLQIQGTSSVGYPRKNLRPRTRPDDYGCVMKDSSGNIIPDGKYSFKDGSQPVNRWTLKADFAESSGSHNTGVARLWNDILYKSRMAPPLIDEETGRIVTNNGRIVYSDTSDYIFRTEAQKTALQNDYKYDVRTTVDGFPIVVFYHVNENDPLICLGQYNFNNDKSNESVFGFKSIPGFDNSNVQCYEFKDNGSALCLFKDVSTFDANWSTAFESRYPDTKTPDLTYLKLLSLWIYSCNTTQPIYDSNDNLLYENGLEKWNAEKAQHFDLPKLCAYYVYLMRFGAADQVVKNSMITTEDGQHWFFINYDNDTILGIDNESKLFDRWDYVRSTKQPNNTYYYAGNDSVLWNCFEADPECMQLVIEVDQALYGGGLTYRNMLKMFDEEQCDKWCERIYNDNANYKYILPYTESNTNDLWMLQGSRKSHRHWWLLRRMDMFDSMWATGAYNSRNIQFKVGLPSALNGTHVDIVAGADANFSFNINDTRYDIGTHVSKGESTTFTFPSNRKLVIGDVLYLCNANNIEEVDFSDYRIADYITLCELKDINGNDESNLLKRIILGSATTNNSTLTTISTLSTATKLEELDIRGFKAMLTVNGLSDLKNLHVFRAINSGLTEFIPAQGATLTEVSLPDTLQSINLDHVSISNLTYTPNNTLLNVSFKSVTGDLDTGDFVLDWIDTLQDSDLINAKLYFDNINIETTTANLLKLSRIYSSNRTLKGVVYVTDMTQANYDSIINAFGSSVFDLNSEFIVNTKDSVILLNGQRTFTIGLSEDFSITRFPLGSPTDFTYLLDGIEAVEEDGLNTYSTTYSKLIETGHFETYFNEAPEFYGVKWAPSISGSLVRIGNPDFHRELPIQSKMRRCTVKDDGSITGYISSTDYTKYTDGTTAHYDGTDGQVMVEVPEYYYKAYSAVENNVTWNYLELYPLGDFFANDPTWMEGKKKARKHYVGAFEAISGSIDAINDTILSATRVRSDVEYTNIRNGSITVNEESVTCAVVDVDDQVGLPLILKDGSDYYLCSKSGDDYTKLSDYSVTLSDYYTDSKNAVMLDTVLDNTSVFGRDIRYTTGSSCLAVVNVSRPTFRTRAKKHGATTWSQQSWVDYEAIVRLYVVEYCAFNVQQAFNPEKTVDGYAQGGLTGGVTSATATNGGTATSSYNATPIGITMRLCNNSGFIKYYSGSNSGYWTVPSYRGIENPYGNIWTFLDGFERRGSTADGSNKEELYVCEDVSKFTSLTNENISLGVTFTDNYTTWDDSALYLATGYRLVLRQSPISGGEQKNVAWDENGTFWPKSGGSYSFSDYFWNAYSNNTWYTLYAGGYADHGARCGWFCLSAINASAIAYDYFGSRLQYTPSD